MAKAWRGWTYAYALVKSPLSAHEGGGCDRRIHCPHATAEPSRECAQHERNCPEERAPRNRLPGTLSDRRRTMFGRVHRLTVLLLVFRNLCARLIDGNILRLGDSLSCAIAAFLLLLGVCRDQGPDC